MEIRKIQKTGGSSFVITLPKEWIKQLKIKEKSSLAFFPQPDGTLLLSAKYDKEDLKREIIINIEERMETDFLMRKLIGSYIMGFNLIRILFNGAKFPPKIRKTVKIFKESVIGFEISDETRNSVDLMDLLNPSEMQFDASIKRMKIGVLNMHEDLMQALKTSDRELVNDVISRDVDINRRHRLIARQSNLILHDITLAQKMNVTLEDSQHSFLISKQLERVGDHAKNIAESILFLMDKDLDEDLILKLVSLSNMSMKTLEDSLIAWEKRKLELANTVLKEIDILKNQCEEIMRGEFKDPDISVHIGYIVESIGRTGEYGVNIAEIVFDNLLKD